MDQTFSRYEVSNTVAKSDIDDNDDLISKFIAAKRIEGCSEKTLKYYQTTIEAMISTIEKSVRHIVTEDLRAYLTDYQASGD